MTRSPGLTGLCVGYELKRWRTDELADHALNWLPEFALSRSEASGLHAGNARRLLRQAARLVYSTDKYAKRGEFGELFLHIAIRQVFHTVPAVSKIFFKDAPNDTVKGFDCVHVVVNDDNLELWLGEAKFYTDIQGAIRAACQSLSDHTDRDYFRAEMAAIRNKIDSDWPAADKLRLLMREETSLDAVFDALTIPVLLTYDSNAVRTHDAVSAEYVSAFCLEVDRHYESFAGANPIQHLHVHLFLLPLEEKAKLITALHEKLRHSQDP